MDSGRAFFYGIFTLLLIALVGTIVFAIFAQPHAQPFQPYQSTNAGQSRAFATVNASVTITTGNTFQQALASVVGSGTTERNSLTIQNNQATGSDLCWVYFGATASATKALSLVLSVGTRYRWDWPYVPADAVQVTCATTSDTVYVDYQ